MCVTFVLLARFASAFARTWKIRARALPRAPGPAADAWVGTSAGAGAGADIRVTASLAAPVTFGSTVLLPADYLAWSDAKRRAVITHELAHVKARDCRIQWLAALHVCCFWFNPIAWWLKRRLAELAELVSDDAVLRQAAGVAHPTDCVDRTDYASILLDVARTRTVAAQVSGAAVSMPVRRVLRHGSSEFCQVGCLIGSRHSGSAR